METRTPEATWNFSDLLLLLLVVILGTTVMSGLVNLTLSYLHLNDKLLGIIQFLLMVFGQSMLTVAATFGLIWAKKGTQSVWALLSMQVTKITLHNLMWGVMVGLMLTGFAFGAEWILQSIQPKGLAQQSIALTIAQVDNLGLLVLLFVFGAILAPISEEILYRGFAFPLFRIRYEGSTSLWLGGAFFGLMHFDLYRFLPLTVTGVILNWLYRHTGSLYACMVAHVLWNGIMTVIVYSM